MSELSSDFHLILNPDVILEEGVLLSALETLMNDKSIVMLSPSATSPIGNKLHLCKRFPSVLILLIRGFLPDKAKKVFHAKLKRHEMHELEETGLTTEVPLASGCFMFVKTEAFKKIGGFDERYFLYFEDFDLSIRMSKLGKLVYAPNVKIIHGGGNASKKGLWHIINFVKSGFRFFNIHGWNIF
jgi:GT2 family glycosyltransferase